MITSKIKNLTEVQYGDLLELNLGDKGYSRRHVVKARETSDDNCYVIMHYSEKLLGWALLAPEYNNKTLTRYGVNVFVAKESRRIGIGSFLFKEADNLVGVLGVQAYCSIWSEESDFFYSKMKPKHIRIYRSVDYDQARRGNPFRKTRS